MQSFHNPVRIRFGVDAREGLADLVAGRRTVVLSSEGMARRGGVAATEAAVGSAHVATYPSVAPNPTVASASAAFAALRDSSPELIVAMGGGSVLDTAKAVAAQCANPADGWLSDHLRDGAPFDDASPPPPIIAIPTTAGTGSEVTMWGTIWDEANGKKYSISHPSLFPEHALLDPTLTLSVPAATTTATALDALSHAMEAIWNRSANPVSDALAAQAIRTIPTSLRATLAAPDDLPARTSALSAALVAGLAMSNTRTAIAHSISYPVTSILGVQHGIACSVTLPEILRELAESHPKRASLIVDALGAASVTGAIAMLYDLFRDVGVRDQLTAHVPTAETLEAVKGRLITPGRADNSLVPATPASAERLLETAYRAICA